MLYKFKSKATGDVLMLGPNGDQLLRLLGREPAAQGIFEPQDMPAMITALQAAAEADERERQPAAAADEEAKPGREVSLRQRLWPMVEMLQRAHEANVPVVWGV